MGLAECLTYYCCDGVRFVLGYEYLCYEYFPKYPDHALDRTCLLQVVRGDELQQQAASADQRRVVAADENLTIVRFQ